jgi:hypothetical protein
VSAVLKDLEQAEAAERMSDDELYEKYLSPEAVAHFIAKYPREPQEPLESEFYADQYSCPERLFR